MVTSLVGVLVLAIIVAVGYIRNGTVRRSDTRQMAGVTAPQTADYTGSIGGTILVGMFGLGYFLAVVFSVIWLIVH